MTSEPIPKTIPRSTLACPPAKNFSDQYKGSTQATKNSTSGGVREQSKEKAVSKNDS